VEDKLARPRRKSTGRLSRARLSRSLAEPAGDDACGVSTRLAQAGAGAGRLKILATSGGAGNGVFDIEEQYEIRVSPEQAGGGFALPAPYGLINQVTLTVVNLDVDVLLGTGRFH